MSDETSKSDAVYANYKKGAQRYMQRIFDDLDRTALALKADNNVSPEDHSTLMGLFVTSVCASIINQTCGPEARDAALHLISMGVDVYRKQEASMSAAMATKKSSLILPN